jgi:predicted ester cyclase
MLVALLVIGLTAGLAYAPWQPARAQGATPTAACSPMTEEQNVAVALRFLEDAIGGHDANVLREIMGPQVAYHAAAGTDVDTVEEVMALISGTITAFPDVHYTIDKVITDGELVALIWHAEGTNAGSLQGRPPTGKAATWTGINAFRVECGQIVEVWAEFNALGRLQQIGAIATPAP